MATVLRFQSAFYLSVPRKCVEDEDLKLTAAGTLQWGRRPRVSSGDRTGELIVGGNPTSQPGDIIVDAWDGDKPL